MTVRDRQKYGNLEKFRRTDFFFFLSKIVRDLGNFMRE